MAQLEHNYYDISQLYDMAEELAETIDRAHVADPKAQLALMEPLIEQVSESAEVLEEEYLTLAGGNVRHKAKVKSKVESALRKIFTAIDAYGQAVGREAGEAIDNIKNVADPIVRKMKRHMETIIGHFLALIDLSLDMVMHKNDIEELKRRHSQIAAMLHAASQGHVPGQQV